MGEFHVCGASVILYSGRRILLQKRRDNGCWGYPGGHLELGESTEEAAKRELLEETAMTANALTLFGVFSGPALRHRYPDGNIAHFIDVVYLCDDFMGTPACQAEEVLDIQWFDVDRLPERISPPSSRRSARL